MSPPFCPAGWRVASLWLTGFCNVLFAGKEVTKHVTNERPGSDPLSQAMEWVTKITTVALEMVLPAIGGGWLDKRMGTSYWALVGLVFGMVVGMWHLLQMTRPKSGPRGTPRDQR